MPNPLFMQQSYGTQQDYNLVIKYAEDRIAVIITTTRTNPWYPPLKDKMVDISELNKLPETPIIAAAYPSILFSLTQDIASVMNIELTEPVQNAKIQKPAIQNNAGRLSINTKIKYGIVKEAKVIVYLPIDFVCNLLITERNIIIPKAQKAIMSTIKNCFSRADDLKSNTGR